MTHVLLFGRDLSNEGTATGPEVEQILRFAVDYQIRTGVTLVVAAGFSPDFPHQPRSYAAMMAERLSELGATDVVVLTSDHFSSFGELSVFHKFCCENKIVRCRVLGFGWHLKRVLFEARQVNKRWAKELKPINVPGKMKAFDLFIEPLKWAKLILPRSWQVRAIKFYKRRVSQRTSY